MRFHISGKEYIILIIFDKLQHLINNLGHVTLSALNQQSAIWWSDCYKKMPNIICDFHLAEALKAVNHHSCDSVWKPSKWGVEMADEFELRGHIESSRLIYF